MASIHGILRNQDRSNSQWVSDFMHRVVTPKVPLDTDYILAIKGIPYQFIKSKRSKVVKLVFVKDGYKPQVSCDNIQPEEFKTLQDIAKTLNISVDMDRVFTMLDERSYLYRALASRIEMTTYNTGCYSYFDKFLGRFKINMDLEVVKAESLMDSGSSVEKWYAYILIHELEHIIRKHCTKESNIDHNMENDFQDLEINTSIKMKYYMSYPVLGISNQIVIKGRLKKEYRDLFRFASVMSKLGLINSNSSQFKNVKLPADSEFVWTISQNLDKDKYYDLELLDMKLMELFSTVFEAPPEINNGLIFEGLSELMELELSEESVEEFNKIIVGIASEAESLMASEEGETHNAIGVGLGKGASLLEQTEAVMDRMIKGSMVSRTLLPRWKRELKRQVVKGLSTKEKYNSELPNARVEMQFGREIDIPYYKKVVFCIDMSGSMDVNDYEFCIQEVDNCIKALNASVKVEVLWWGSSVVHEKFSSYREFLDRIKNRKAPSLGGTRVELALEFLDKCKADLKVIATDGHFYIERDTIDKNIIWCITPDGKADDILSKNKQAVIIQPTV